MWRGAPVGRPALHARQEVRVRQYILRRIIYAIPILLAVATLTFLLNVGGRLYVGGVGDSRTYLLRDGKLEQLTKIVRALRLSTLLLQAHLQRLQLLLECGVLLLNLAKRDVSRPHPLHAVDRCAGGALQFGKAPERHDFQHRYSGRRIDLSRNQNDMQQYGGAQHEAGSLSDVCDRHDAGSKLRGVRRRGRRPLRRDVAEASAQAGRSRSS